MKKNKTKKQSGRVSLTLLFAVVIFCVLLIAILLALGLVVLLIQLHVFKGVSEEIRMSNVLMVMALISLVMGAALVFIVSKISVNPIDKFVNGLNSLAAGNFKTRISYKGALANQSSVREVTDSFNKLARELENTEMLRSDFINNFSHEFKTPIVSIAGFAKLLQKGNLTEEQRMQYLNAIEEESMRLSYMATNILNMTKIENQEILTDVTRFNLSEQIRFAVLLMEEQWTKKNIELQLDFDEHEIEANEELLKQIWINLVGNAVKFAPRCATVAIDICATAQSFIVSVSNTGQDIPPEKQKKLFNKFYQADESHAQEGNGIGLAVVKKIVDLHGGWVSVKSEKGMTVFTVELPKIQTQTAANHR
jgi:signal transduction histidine kinase